MSRFTPERPNHVSPTRSGILLDRAGPLRYVFCQVVGYPVGGVQGFETNAARTSSPGGVFLLVLRFRRTPPSWRRRVTEAHDASRKRTLGGSGHREALQRREG